MSRGATRKACTSSRFIRAVRLAGTGATLSGVLLWLRSQPTFLPHDSVSKTVAAGVLSLLFLLAAAAAPGCQVQLPGGPGATWRAALRRVPGVGLALSPLALLPLCRGHAAIGAVLVCTALVAYIACFGSSTLRARRPARGHPFGPWEVALLGFCVFVAIVYVQIGLRAQGSFQNDSAYYFGVAKHIVLTGRFEEPIVWHFLRIPSAIPTAPFDYWGGLTSVVLLPFLWVAGPSHHVANTVMSCVSALSVLAFWYLVAVRRIVRSPPIGAVLIVAFAFAPSLSNYRFDTESVALYHLVALLALVCATHKRWALCSILAALVYFARPSGALLALLFWIWALYESRKQRTMRRVLATQIALAVVTLGFGFIAYGSPLGVLGKAARLHYQLDLYSWNGAAPLDLLHARLAHFYLVTRIAAVVQTLLQIVPGGTVLLLFCVVAGLAPWIAEARQRSAERVVVWTLGLPVAVAVGLASGAVFVPWRTLHPLIPFVMLAGGQSLDWILGWLWHLDIRRAARAVAALTLLVVTGVFVLRSIAIYGDRQSSPIRSAEAALQKLDPVLDGETVASNVPWYVIADTRSPAVSIPRDGAAAIQAVIRKYHVEWVLIVGKPSTLEKSGKPIHRLLANGSARFGPYTLVRDRNVHSLALFRVEVR